MKYIAPIATVAALAVVPANAGTLTEPEVEQAIEETVAGPSSNGILIPLLLLGVVAAVIASSGDDDEGRDLPPTRPPIR